MTIKQMIERELVGLVSSGDQMKVIAAKTGYNQTSVERMVRAIRHKYGAKNNPHLVRIWFEKGLFGKV